MFGTRVDSLGLRALSVINNDKVEGLGFKV